MRSLFNYILLLTGFTLFLAACNKVDDLPRYEKGAAVTLTASSSSIAPTPADSTKSVVDFSWTNPNYATDTSNYKFVVEIDSAGRNFTKPTKRELLGKRSLSLTGRELNAILLDYGFAVGRPHSLDVRVTSSYANNNEQYLSNVLKINVTPFSDPSKLTSSAATVTVALATQDQKALTFTWSPSFQGYTGAVTYTLQYDSTGKNFANVDEKVLGSNLVAQNNLYSWDLKQGEVNESALNSGIAGGAQGKVDYRIKATTAQGALAYSNVVSVTINSYLPEAIYPTLYMVGDLSGWNNATAWPIFRSETNAFGYTYTGYLPAGSFKFISTLGQWAPMWGNGGAGKLQYRATESDPDPATFQITTAGYYTINLDVQALTYSIQPYDASSAPVYSGTTAVGIVGSFKSWDNIEPMTTRPQNPHIWETEYTFTAGASELKFRIASGWTQNWGPTEENRPKLYGKGVQDGKNLKVPTGTYRIVFNDLTGHYVFIKK
jgi:starch-binding outer membrane protein SusE/F